MTRPLLEHLTQEIQTLKDTGYFKNEHQIRSPQRADIELKDGRHVLNFCANNYLGLADDPRISERAAQALKEYGFGMASVRFICGTQTIHKELEARVSAFLGTEDTILYTSCFDANGGLFETILSDQDAVISDELNHASIIDGVRLCKARRFRYKNNDMSDLEAQLQAADAAGARFKLIATDGVFSMDGIIANLKGICDLAEKYDAYVMVDDSHAVGFIGENGRGTPEFCGVGDRVDIYTGTFGKALGGASGGYTSGRKEIVQWLRQRSRPYLFSNSVAPNIVAATLATLDILETEGKALRAKLQANSQLFRREMTDLGFDLVPGEHPIIPVMLGDAVLAGNMAKEMMELGVYVVGFSFPVVPRGKARIRTQMSAGHETEHIERAVKAFEQAGKKVGAI